MKSMGKNKMTGKILTKEPKLAKAESETKKLKSSHKIVGKKDTGKTNYGPSMIKKKKI